MQLFSETFSQKFECQSVNDTGLICPSPTEMFQKRNGDFQAAFFIIIMESSTAYQPLRFVCGLSPAEFLVGR